MPKKTLHTQKSAIDGPSVNPKFQVGKRPAWSVEELERAILNGDRAALAAGITLVESEVAEDAMKAVVLLEKLLPHAGNSLRLGISGVPGVGKSTFLESYGVHYLESNDEARPMRDDDPADYPIGRRIDDVLYWASASVVTAAFLIV